MQKSYSLVQPAVIDSQGASEFHDWKIFWQRRLQQRVPPVGMESAWHVWMSAEDRACAGDYDGLREALLRVL